MADVTHHYCAHCKRYIGTAEVPQCPYCGVVFNVTEALGTIVRTKVETKVNTRPLKYTIVASLGIGSCLCTTAVTLSWFSQEWAAFFSSLATSFTWQFTITAIFFSVFFSVLRGLFWEKIDNLLLAYDNWTAYSFLQKLRHFLAPLVRHRRMATILLLISASIIALPLLAWKFNRPLDGYDIGFNLVVNILGGLFIVLIEDLMSQRERIKRERDWRPPPTLADWERMAKRKEP